MIINLSTFRYSQYAFWLGQWTNKADVAPISLKLHVYIYRICRWYRDVEEPGWIDCMLQICGYIRIPLNATRGWTQRRCNYKTLHLWVVPIVHVSEIFFYWNNVSIFICCKACARKRRRDDCTRTWRLCCMSSGSPWESTILSVIAIALSCSLIDGKWDLISPISLSLESGYWQGSTWATSFASASAVAQTSSSGRLSSCAIDICEHCGTG